MLRSIPVVDDGAAVRGSVARIRPSGLSDRARRRPYAEGTRAPGADITVRAALGAG